MSGAKPIELVSPDEFLAGEDLAKRKHEYVAGLVYAMAGAKNTHNAIVTAFLLATGVRLRGKRCQGFNSDTKVRIRNANGTFFYYPDGMIVCSPNAGEDVYQDQPVVLAEVLSPSTRRIDERSKRDDYLTIPSLSSYLLIETTKPRVTVYQREGEGFVDRVYDGINAIIPLPVADISLPLAELYERVDFEAAARAERPEIDDDEIVE